MGKLELIITKPLNPGEKNHGFELDEKGNILDGLYRNVVLATHLQCIRQFVGAYKDHPSSELAITGYIPHSLPDEDADFVVSFMDAIKWQMRDRSACNLRIFASDDGINQFVKQYQEKSGVSPLKFLPFFTNRGNSYLNQFVICNTSTGEVLYLPRTYMYIRDFAKKEIFPKIKIRRKDI